MGRRGEGGDVVQTVRNGEPHRGDLGDGDGAGVCLYPHDPSPWLRNHHHHDRYDGGG